MMIAMGTAHGGNGPEGTGGTGPEGTGPEGTGGTGPEGTGPEGTGPEGTGPGDLRLMATERLEAEITTLAAHLAAAMCRWLLMVAEYERRRAFMAWECVSMEHWLSIHAGIAASTARAHLAVARELGGLPVTTKAFAEGRLSYSKVRALCRVATADNEHEWVELAQQATASQLERLTGDVRRVAAASEEGRAAAQHDERSFSWEWTDGGMLQVRGLLPPETGAVLVRLLLETTTALQADERTGTERTGTERTGTERTGPGPTGVQRHADALGLVLRRIGSLGSLGSLDERGEARPLLVVHRERDGACRIEHGPPVPTEVADELACDCDVQTATHSEAGIGFDRRRRFPAAALRRHVLRRDGGCVFPGCGRRLGVATHHIREYHAHGGETTRENLIVLCAVHHGAIHRRGWAVSGSAEDGSLRFTDPSGRPVSGGPRVTGSPQALVSANLRHGIRPDHRSARARAMGERYDHAHAVWVLANSLGGRPRARSSPASAEAGQGPAC